MGLLGSSYTSNADVARLTPREYLLLWNIALPEHRDCALILGIGALSIVLIAPLVWTLNGGFLALVSDAINLAIYAIGARGCIAVLHALAQTRIERALAAEIVRKAGQPQSQAMELSKLPEYILPQNNTEPPLAMPRIVYSIQQEAQNLRFGSGAEIVQPYTEEATESVFEVVNLQKVALRSGICATFIGLLIALKQMAAEQGAIVPSQENVLGILVQHLSASLFIAFSGSAIGLQVALILGALLLSLRTNQAALFREMMEAAAVTVHLARKARNDGQQEVINEISGVQELIRTLTTRIIDHGARIETSLGLTQERINLQTNAIAAGLEQLAKTKQTYDDIVSGVAMQQNNFMTEVRDVYRNLSLDSFRQEMRSGIVQAGETIAGTLNETRSAIDSQTGEITEGVKMLVKTSEHMTTFLKDLDNLHQTYLAKTREAQNADPFKESHMVIKIALNQLRDSVEKLNASVNTPIWSRILVWQREPRRTR